MSPSEFELRDALRDGEGDGLDSDALIRSAVQIRHTRRVRLGAIAASVVAVGAIGTGAVQLVQNGSSSQASKSSADTGFGAEQSVPSAPVNRGALPNQPSAGTAGGAGTTGGTDSQAATCPSSVPRLAVPGGGGTGQFGSGGPLFAGVVTQLVVCAYPMTASPTSIVLSGTEAASAAAGLNNAATTNSTTLCPYGPSSTGQLVLLATTAGGRTLPPVVATRHCTWTLTNGTAVRYDWTPPTSLTGVVADATAGSGNRAGPPHASGSPMR